MIRRASKVRPLLSLPLEGVRHLQQTARALARASGFSATVVLTLSLGIGASTAIFSVVDQVLIAPLPYPEPRQLAVLFERSPGAEGRSGWVSPLTFRDWREQTRVFEDIVSYRLDLQTWTGSEVPTLLRGWAVSAGYFRLMGIGMTLGRGFTADEDLPRGRRVVVISHDLWVREFGSDPGVLGRAMTLGGEPHTIVGVAGPELDFPSRGAYWRPAATDYASEMRDFRYMGVIGRLRPGARLADAQAELDLISRRIAADNPTSNTGWGAEVRGLRDYQLTGVDRLLIGIALAVALLLLISVGNVANLTIARSSGRRVDNAVRKALGASRGALLRLYFSEFIFLSLLGSALGLAAAYFGIRALVATTLLSLPRGGEISLDARAAGFAVCLAVLVGLVLGVVAALVSGRSGLTETLRAGGPGVMAPGRTHGVREAVLAGQVALALCLMIGASLLTRSLMRLGAVDVGFSPKGITTFSYTLPASSYPDPGAQRTFERSALEALRGISGVEAVGVVTPLPMEMGSTPTSWSLPPDLRDPSEGAVMAHMRTASPGYFPAMGIRLFRGRLLDDGDRENSEGVAVVNRSFVETYLPGRDPVGVRITPGEPDAPASEWITIVGVVGDVRFRSLTAESEPEIYIPTSQFCSSWGHFVVRSDLPREQVVQVVSEAIRRADPNLPLADVKTGEEIIGGQLRTSRLSALLTSLFAASATVLAVIGIIGLLSILVAQRMREIGLRIALGAGRARIRGLVVRCGMRPVLLGVIAGLLISLGALRLLQSQIQGVRTFDLLAISLPTLALTIAGLAACVIPGARAASANPASLLRSE